MLYKNPFDFLINLQSIVHIPILYKWMQKECI